MSIKFKNTCLMFDAYKLNDISISNYRAYKSALEGICDVYFIFHDPSGNALTQDAGMPEDAIILTDSDIFETHPCRKSESRQLIPGNCDLKTIAAAERLDKYRRYISVEFDVLCLTDIRRTIIEMVHATSDFDLVGSYIRSYEYAPSWVWWKTLTPPPGSVLDEKKKTKSFLPLSIYSRKFFRLYREALNQGWGGHQETLMPTIAAMNDLPIYDLSLPPHRFTQSPQFKVKSPDGLDELDLPAFIHPVKSLQQYLNIPIRARRNCELMWLTSDQ